MDKPRGFHANDGWYFRRFEDGRVEVSHWRQWTDCTDNDPCECRDEADCHARAVREGDCDAIGSFSADTWASIVAFVSALGENAERWYAARELHNGPVRDATQMGEYERGQRDMLGALIAHRAGLIDSANASSSSEWARSYRRRVDAITAEIRYAKMEDRLAP